MRGAAVRAIFGGFGDEVGAAEQGRVADAPGDEGALRPTPPVGRSGCGGAEVYYDQGALEAAADAFESVVPLWREVGARPGPAQALTNLAGALLEEALGLWRSIGNRWGEAWALYTLGRVAQAEVERLAGLLQHQTGAGLSENG